MQSLHLWKEKSFCFSKKKKKKFLLFIDSLSLYIYVCVCVYKIIRDILVKNRNVLAAN